MAKELQGNAGPSQTGLTTYFIVWNTVGQVRSGGTTFATASAANRNAGAISATELGTASGVYVADSPAFATGDYPYALYKQVGGSPAETDTLLAGPGRPLHWDGSAVVYLGTAPALVRSYVDSSIAAVQADLPQRITKNVALSAFMFLLVDSADHVTPKTGRTVTATRSLDGAAFAASANSVSEVSSGWYKIDLAAADLNGTVVALRFTATGADDRNITIITEPT